MSKPSKEDLEALEDLNLLDTEATDDEIVRAPEEEHMLPTYEEEPTGVEERSYLDSNPSTTRVVPLPKRDYNRIQAVARFDELRLKYPKWRWLGDMFWTATHWCWRIDER